MALPYSWDFLKVPSLKCSFRTAGGSVFEYNGNCRRLCNVCQRIRGLRVGPLIWCLQQIRLEQANTPCEDLNVKLPVHRLGRDEFRELSLQYACCSKHSRGLRLTEDQAVATIHGHVVDRRSRERVRSDRSCEQLGSRVGEPRTRRIDGEKLGHSTTTRNT